MKIHKVIEILLFYVFSTICYKHEHADINSYYILALWSLTVESTSSAHYLLDSVHKIHTCNTHLMLVLKSVTARTIYVAKTTIGTVITLYNITSSRVYSIELSISSCTVPAHSSCTYVHWTYTSSSSMRTSSLEMPSSEHRRTSMSSLTSCGRVLQNHGIPACAQQLLPGPHPSPSHRGSSRYILFSCTPVFPDSQK